MQVLKFIQQNNCVIPYNIGDQIDPGGSDGEIFSLIDYPNHVIKLCILDDLNEDPLQDHYKSITNSLNYILNNKPEAYVNIIKHDCLGIYFRNWFSNLSMKYVLYYYVMEKLNKISDDEKKIFHTILSHEDNLIKKNYSFSKIKKMLKSMSSGLDFDFEKIMLFCNNIAKAPVIHKDLHPRNIMVNDAGYFKLIDLDRSSLII